MQKLFTLLSVVAIFSGCSQVQEAQEDAQKLIDDGKQSYENVTNKVTETVDDVNAAVTAVEDAKAAVKEVTE